ncbi:glycosyl hydrolase [Danxiaibacter flavus]|uniref:Glycosyl hydrolase n=1 Tax=Danxiaibacter flavus TaxID=3049108 RepID=A0ABV3ZIG3_9BACT|nr:glycosyl hydrolase [Chitinophagaceae bacterium DXS]
MKRPIVFSAALLACLSVFSQKTNKTSGDTMYANFSSPPNAAKPRVWWHWMNGNVTKDGIRKDLEWMHRAGIGGFQNFDASLNTPQIVEKRLTYMTPEWKDAFHFTAQLADSLHLEMAIAGSPGWSESGGPWVKPEDGMKKIVWSETRVQGGSSTIALAKPPSVTGPFQNLHMKEELSLGGPATEPPVFYKEIAVIAYKLPDNDKTLMELKPTVTSSAGHFELSQLTDGDLTTANLLPADTSKGFAWIQFAFAQPQTIKAVTMVGGGNKGPFGMFGDFKDTRSLEASDDGTNFKWICYIPAGNVLQQTVAIPTTTAKYFRVTVKNPPPPMNFGAMLGNKAEPPKPPAGTDIAEVVLHTATRINMFEEKDAFSPAPNLNAQLTNASDNTDAIAAGDVIDITSKMNADGVLNWTAPAGNWNIVRFGYSLMGITNHPASPGATGLEVDKLDRTAVKNYFTNYLDQYKNATNGLMGNNGGLQYMVTDSWEAGSQNWTANMLQEFETRRGYSMLPWMPVLTGHIVKSAEASEKFLWDFRKTLSDLVASNHYDQLTDLLQQYGMKRYSESHESGRALIADGMDIKRSAAVPMSAIWMPGAIGGGQTMHEADIRESASVAHIYGQNLVAAESLTALGIGGSAWSYSPDKLKPTADLELASGLNRFVIHTSVHQPVDNKIPGLGLGPFGQWFNRHETWAEQAIAWTNYLARSCYMLQQGKFVADLIYYYGEDNNITALFGKKLPAIPEGYNFDFINADALINLLSVKDGRLVTPSGMNYRVLVLDSNARQMSLPVLKKINELVKAGATISGIVPESVTGLKDSPDEFKSLVQAIWGSGNSRVIANKTVSETLTALNIVPDVTYNKPQQTSRLLYVHRKASDRDIYWINNRTDRTEDFDISFRMEGKVPELWHAETGEKEALPYNIANGTTKTKLHLEPNDAVFVVFKDKAATNTRTLPSVAEKELVAINESWNISFQKDRGAPTSVNVNTLSSWTDNQDNGVKYFSGTGTYTKTINASAQWFSKNAQIWLDLGEVKNMAEVIVNGKSLGIVWKHPFCVNVTSALKTGNNTVEVKVTNLWVNRLIGDQQPGVINKITYTTMPFYQSGSPLLPSGLLGPVKLIQKTTDGGLTTAKK